MEHRVFYILQKMFQSHFFLMSQKLETQGLPNGTESNRLHLIFAVKKSSGTRFWDISLLLQVVLFTSLKLIIIY